MTIPPLSIKSNDPTIGGELLSSGLYALFIALGLQLLYITFRFSNQWRYGIAADSRAAGRKASSCHGQLLRAFNRQIGFPFLAALSTGHRLFVMDSIVIFDRIRENVKLNRKADFEQVVNKSVDDHDPLHRHLDDRAALPLRPLLLRRGDAAQLRLRAAGGASRPAVTPRSSLHRQSWWCGSRMAKAREGGRQQQRRAMLAQPKAGAAPVVAAEEKADKQEAKPADTAPTPRRTARRKSRRR